MRPNSPHVHIIAPGQADWATHANTTKDSVIRHFTGPLPLATYDSIESLPDAADYQYCIATVIVDGTPIIFTSDGSSWGQAIGTVEQLVLLRNYITGDGLTATDQVWSTVPLSEITTDQAGGVSLTSNIVTLPAGNYHVRAEVVFSGQVAAMLRLYDVDGSSMLLYGIPCPGDYGFADLRAVLVGYIELSSETEVRLDCITKRSATGPVKLGSTPYFADGVYNTFLEFWRMP